jgi:hypothetical protein
MSFRLSTVFAGLALALTSVEVVGAQDAAPVYPQYRLTPQNPKYGDSVSLWIVKGQGATDCVPMYRTSFTKTPEICNTAACTAYTLTVSYQEYMPNYFVCNQVLTEYGPRYEFGKLSVMKYAVVDSATNREIFRFQVSPAYCTISGTVETPSSPGLARRADTVSFMPLPVSACTVIAQVPYQTVQSGVMAITDAEGRYVIANIEVWNCFGDSVVVVTKKTGYAESRQTVVLAGKDSVRADFSLKQVASGIGSANILRANKIQDAFISVYSLNGRKLVYHIVKTKDPFDLRNTNVPRGIAFMRIVDNGRDETRSINVENGR